MMKLFERKPMETAQVDTVEHGPTIKKTAHVPICAKAMAQQKCRNSNHI